MPNALSDCTIPLVLKKIGKDRLAGCLTVKVEGGSRQLFFENGVLCFARTDDPDLRLGSLLVATGSISSVDLGLFDPVLRMKGDKKVGEVLTDLGLISTPILQQALTTQMLRIAADLFPRREGSWAFSPMETVPKNSQGLSLEMAVLMREGIRAISDFSFYKKAFGEMSPRPSDQVDSISVELTTVQRKFISKVGRFYPTPNSRMPFCLNMSEDLYWRAALLFFLLGRLEFVDRSQQEVESNLEDTVIIRMQEVDAQVQAEPQIQEEPPVQEEAVAEEISVPAPLEGQPVSREIVAVADERGKAETSVPTLQQMDPETCFEKAEAEFASRNFLKVLSLLEMAIRKGQPRPKYYQLLGRAQMQFPNLRRDAEDSFLKQAELEPWNADPYYYLGELYQIEGLSMRAEKQFQKALELNMDHTKAGIRMNQLNPALFRATAGQKKKKK